jgi:hypothetical protein
MEMLTSELEWIRPEAPFVVIDKFGKDHWATFAYIETRTVDYLGVLEHDHMRCNEIRHPLMANAGKRGLVVGGTPGSAYATRLKKTTRVSGQWESEELFDHDDYDCVNDLIAAGLLEVTMPGVNGDGVYVDARGRIIKYEGERLHESFITGLGEAHLAQFATFRLTDLGLVVASQLRAHKGDGGNFHGFVPVI